jgi:hypothetical protein
MSDWRAWSGWAGVVFIALNVVSVIVFFTGGIPPKLADTASYTEYVNRNGALMTTIAVVSTINVAFFYVWVLGLRGAIRSAGQDFEWAAAFTFGLGLVLGVGMILAATLLGATGLDASMKADPAAVRVLSDVSLAIYPVLGVPVALLCAAASYAASETGVFSAVTSRIGYAAALLNLAALPSLYGGTDPTTFYSAAGFATIVLSLIPLLVFVGAVSVAFLRAPLPIRARVSA